MDKNEILSSLKKVGLAVVLFFLAIFGLVSVIGSLNWAFRGDGNENFIVGALVGFVETLFVSVLFYRKYLKF